MRQPRQPSPSSTSTESVIAWPDRLVPAARNVTGVPEPRAGREQAPHLVLALDDDDELRHQPVEARVGAPGEQAQRIGDQPLAGDEGRGLAQQLVVGRPQRRPGIRSVEWQAPVGRLPLSRRSVHDQRRERPDVGLRHDQHAHRARPARGCGRRRSAGCRLRGRTTAWRSTRRRCSARRSSCP